MKVDAALMADPVRLLEALLALSRSRVWFWFWKPSAEEWTVDWYVNPASAWWEQ